MSLRTLVLAVVLGLFVHVVVAGTVDINTADAAALASLDGVGEAKAEAIIAYRTQNGPFKSVEDLANVKGIGDKIIAANRDKITIGKAAK